MVRHLPFQTQQALDIIVSGTKNPPYFPAVYVSVEDSVIVAINSLFGKAEWCICTKNFVS